VGYRKIGVVRFGLPVAMVIKTKFLLLDSRGDGKDFYSPNWPRGYG